MSLVDQVRIELRQRRYSFRTEQIYSAWIQRFLTFHQGAAPEDFGESEVAAFLSHLSTHESVSPSSQKQALSAVSFLYAHVLKRGLGDAKDVISDETHDRTLSVLSSDEVELLLNHIDGVYHAMAMLLYGAGMRASEVLGLRVNSVDFDLQRIVIRFDHRQKCRVVPFPLRTRDALRTQIASVKRTHEQDLQGGHGRASMAHALELKYPEGNKTLDWQYLFPSPSLLTDPRTGRRQRHHISESALQSAIRWAIREAGIKRRVQSDCFRHSFAVHMLVAGSDVRTVTEILGCPGAKIAALYRQAATAGAYASGNSDLLPAPRTCERLAWLNRMLRSGLELEEIDARHWSRDAGDYTIYCLAEDGKRVRYIGITQQAPEVRLRQHLADCGRGKNVYKENWIRSCRNRNVPVTIHAVRSGLTMERACMMEFELIRFLKNAFSLVNTHAGGSTGYAGLSEESREKHRVNTESGIMAAIQKELEAEDTERGVSVFDERGCGDE